MIVDCFLAPLLCCAVLRFAALLCVLCGGRSVRRGGHGHRPSNNRSTLNHPTPPHYHNHSPLRQDARRRGGLEPQAHPARRGYQTRRRWCRWWGPARCSRRISTSSTSSSSNRAAGRPCGSCCGCCACCGTPYGPARAPGGSDAGQGGGGGGPAAGAAGGGVRMSDSGLVLGYICVYAGSSPFFSNFVYRRGEGGSRGACIFG